MGQSCRTDFSASNLGQIHDLRARHSIPSSDESGKNDTNTDGMCIPIGTECRHIPHSALQRKAEMDALCLNAFRNTYECGHSIALGSNPGSKSMCWILCKGSSCTIGWGAIFANSLPHYSSPTPPTMLLWGALHPPEAAFGRLFWSAAGLGKVTVLCMDLFGRITIRSKNTDYQLPRLVSAV